MPGKLLSYLVVSILFYSCGYTSYKDSHSLNRGHLQGVSPGSFKQAMKPLGMVKVPEGVFIQGASDDDPTSIYTWRKKTVSISSFWMDATEVTNNEYRQFVYWVRDSVTLARLGFVKPDKAGELHIDWSKQPKLQWNSISFIKSLEPSGLLLASEERINRIPEYNITNLIYYSEILDLKEASKRENAGIQRKNFIIIKRTPIYPDTLCWIRDFSYSYNEPMTKRYFSHPAFGNYPVVGVNWHQATAFCEWRSQFHNSFLESKRRPIEAEYRLPTEAEWEYAARGGRSQSVYPWGNYYLRNKKGCLLANFKPGRGNYPDDGGFYTVQTDAYWPNDYGLYCMSGNVAEWTSSMFSEGSMAFQHDLNPDIRYNARLSDQPMLKRKVIRGGSWKDVGYYLQCGTRTFEYQDTAKSYIGFRCVIDNYK